MQYQCSACACLPCVLLVPFVRRMPRAVLTTTSTTCKVEPQPFFGLCHTLNCCKYGSLHQLLQIKVLCCQSLNVEVRCIYSTSLPTYVATGAQQRSDWCAWGILYGDSQQFYPQAGCSPVYSTLNYRFAPLSVNSTCQCVHQASAAALRGQSGTWSRAILKFAIVVDSHSVNIGIMIGCFL
jgi:hypothetical protein